MSEIIYLAHRIPYPPNKGDKIRSFHLLRQLSAQYDVHLGCFVDDRNDHRYVEDVKAYCASTCFRPLHPVLARLRSLRGLLQGAPLTIPYYFDSHLLSWVKETVCRPDVVALVGYSSPMAQYGEFAKADRVRKVMDFVDVDSDKWRQYAEKTRRPMNWIFSREAKCLAAYELETTRKFDAVTFVSESEAELFSSLYPEISHKVFSVSNGVDIEYFDPKHTFESPYSPDSKPIVFTGMMDYWPNEDAVKWFVGSIFPIIRRKLPTAETWIVGASPTNLVKSLQSTAGVRVTGRVSDVRPYLQHSAAVVAPLRIARGIQNKVLEALAMGKSVVCSPDAAAGLKKLDTAAVTISASEAAFAEAVLGCLDNTNQVEMRSNTRQYVVDNYSWSRNLRDFERLINPNNAVASGV